MSSVCSKQLLICYERCNTGLDYFCIFYFHWKHFFACVTALFVKKYYFTDMIEYTQL